VSQGHIYRYPQESLNEQREVARVSQAGGPPEPQKNAAGHINSTAPPGAIHHEGHRPGIGGGWSILLQKCAVAACLEGL